MEATIIRTDGAEITIRSVRTFRDVALAMRTTTQPEDLDYELVTSDDGKEAVIYDLRGSEVNTFATRALPDIARVAGGTIRGDILVMSLDDFQRLE